MKVTSLRKFLLGLKLVSPFLLYTCKGGRHTWSGSWGDKNHIYLSHTFCWKSHRDIGEGSFYSLRVCPLLASISIPSLALSLFPWYSNMCWRLVKISSFSQAWWCTPLILALRRQRQADFWVLGQPGLQSELQDNQGYTEKPCLEKTKQNKKNKKIWADLTMSKRTTHMHTGQYPNWKFSIHWINLNTSNCTPTTLVCLY